MAQKLTEALGQTVVVDNRTGGRAASAPELAAKSPPDGHTLLLGKNGPLAINPHLYPKLPYDAVRDFAPVALVTVMPFLLVTHPALPVRSVKDLIALAKSRPGQLTYGSPGNGSTTHLANESPKSMTGISVTHVPNKGVAPAATDLISGQTQMMSGDLSTLLPHVKSGRMHALAVTSERRSSLLPGMPMDRAVRCTRRPSERLVRCPGAGRNAGDDRRKAEQHDSRKVSPPPMRVSAWARSAVKSRAAHPSSSRPMCAAKAQSGAR